MATATESRRDLLIRRIDNMGNECRHLGSHWAACVLHALAGAMLIGEDRELSRVVLDHMQARLREMGDALRSDVASAGSFVPFIDSPGVEFAKESNR